MTKHRLHLDFYWKKLTTKVIPILVGLLFCAINLSLTNLAIAQGVVVGTNIQNIAIATFTVDGIQQQAVESSPSGNSVGGNGNGQPTAFVVDRKVDLIVTGNTNSNVTPGDSQSEVTFTLQNQGNAIQEFSLNVGNLLASDDFDITNCNFEVNGVSGTPLPGVVLPTSGNIKLSPDQQASISVNCDVPFDNNGSPILTGQTALVEITAEAEKNEDGTDTIQNTGTDTANGVETVFVDNAGHSDASTDAKHSAIRTYIASSSTAAPTLSMNKTIESVIDPNNGNTAITGSEVTYKIQINTSGIGTIENLIITDPTPVDMTYKTGSIILNNINQTDISDGDSTNFGITIANTATIDLGNFTAGSQYEILLTYTIN